MKKYFTIFISICIFLVNSSGYVFARDETLDAKIKKIVTVNGQKIEKGYSEVSGGLLYEVPLNNGKRHGKYIAYDSQLNKSVEADYKNGELDGMVISYNSSGNVFMIQIYQNGTLIAGECGYGKKWTLSDIVNYNNGIVIYDICDIRSIFN